jgi:hypothetical protein
MMKLRASRLSAAAVAAVVLILMAGSAAIASNMGFKMNRHLCGPGVNLGKNWVSLPYNNPYGNVAGLCSQLGLTSSGFSPAKVTTIDASSTGVPPTISCGTTAATGPAATLVPSRGYQIEDSTKDVIIVGSHNPALSVNLYSPGVSPKGKNWFGVPYHTTWTNVKQFCDSVGLVSTGFTQDSVTLLNGCSTTTPPTIACGASAATGASANFILGYFIQVTVPSAAGTGGVKTFIPAHY